MKVTKASMLAGLDRLLEEAEKNSHPSFHGDEWMEGYKRALENLRFAISVNGDDD